MNRNSRLFQTLAALLFVLLTLALAGCGAEGKTPQPAAGDPPATEPPPAAETAPAQPAEAEAYPRVDESGFVHVRTVEQLLEEIHPLAAIVIEPGRYDLTEFLSDFPNVRDYDAWNDKHEYVRIRDAYDGLEIVVENVSDLYIEGGSEDPAETQLVTEPRYATVLGFTDCTGVELACLTMGHTDGGDCSGNVLDFYNCSRIRLRTMDLYGCGAYGVSAMGGTGDVEISNSTIRDCSYGPFEIYNASDDFTFTACTLVGSEGGGDYDYEGDATLSFVGCAFGEAESNRWYFEMSDKVAFEGCEWSEITIYPDVEPGYEEFYGDYEDYVPTFAPDQMTGLAFERSMLENTVWIGYAAVDPSSGDTRYLGSAGREDAEAEYASLRLDSDGTGRLEYRNDTIGFKWSCLNTNLAYLENEEQRIYVSLYQNEDSDRWLLMQYDNELIWFY